VGAARSRLGPTISFEGAVLRRIPRPIRVILAAPFVVLSVAFALASHAMERCGVASAEGRDEHLDQPI
jgi:hypothetical protein